MSGHNHLSTYNKPAIKKPELGSPPSYITSEDSISLGTKYLHDQVLRAIKEGKPNSLALCGEYFEQVVAKMEVFRLVEFGDDPYASIVSNIKGFIPARDEILSVLYQLIRYCGDRDAGDVVRNFFEQLFRYACDKVGRYSVNAYELDNFKFILYELFLCSVSYGLRLSKFEMIPSMLADIYLNSSEYVFKKEGMISYVQFRQSLISFHAYNEQQSRKFISIVTEHIKERATRPDLTFESIMQADFFLFLYSYVNRTEESKHGWYPATLCFALERYHPFEVFGRSKSRAHFDKFKMAFEIDGVGELVEAIEFIKANNLVPRYQYDFLNIDLLADVRNLCKNK